MNVKVLRAKIHRATVTAAEAEYVGSITIDRDLMEAVGLLPGEFVLVGDLNNGARFETYVIEADPGSGTVCINGAAALLVEVGHRIIIMAHAYLDEAEARTLRPAVALVDDQNHLMRML